MEPMILRREVLPPRQPPEPCSFELEDQSRVLEDQLRASILRAIWTSAALLGLSQVIMRMLELY